MGSKFSPPLLPSLMAENIGCLFTYKDVNVYKRQRDFLQPGQWLDDVCINLSYRLFEEQWPLENFIYMLDPSVVSFIKFQVDDADEFDDLWKGQSLSNYEWIFFPMSDSSILRTNSGTHWSLLVFHSLTSCFYHFDSSSSYNLAVCERFVEKLSEYLKISPTILSVDTPQQANGFDCGVYILLFSEKIAAYLTLRSYSNEDLAIGMRESVCGLGPSDCVSFRHRLLAIIQDMTRS